MSYMLIQDDKYLTGGGVDHTEIADSGGICKNFGGCTEIVVGDSEKAVTRYKVVVGVAPRRDAVVNQSRLRSAPTSIAAPVGADRIREYPRL
jgi:hypothetical protein